MPAFNNPLHTRQWNNFDGARMPTRPFRHTMNGTNGVAVHSPVSSGWPALPLFHSHKLPKKREQKKSLSFIFGRRTVTLDKHADKDKSISVSPYHISSLRKTLIFDHNLRWGNSLKVMASPSQASERVIVPLQLSFLYHRRGGLSFRHW